MTSNYYFKHDLFGMSSLLLLFIHCYPCIS